MIYLDDKTDTILPYGLKGTPFETVFKAIQSAAASVWAVDPAVYRAGIAWMYYATTAPDVLSNISRDLLSAALVSEAAPLVKDTQTAADLVGLLAAWREYRPTYEKMEGLFPFYAAQAEVLPITDPESQEVLPVTPDVFLQFYIKITEVDWARPLTTAEAVQIGVNASPIGGHAYAYYGLDGEIAVTVSDAYGDAVLQIVGDDLCLALAHDYGVMSDSGDEDLRSVVWGDDEADPQALAAAELEGGTESVVWGDDEADPQALAAAELGGGPVPVYGEIDMAVDAIAYLRASAYQHLNKAVTANSSNVLYESGADAGLAVDGTKTYTLLGAYTNADVSVDITGASLTLLASGGLYYLRLVWGPTAAQVCYIKYRIS
ncbi:MAG: hypothetical protein IKA48_08425 [Fibrobacter sp.]|nr:hypothetical protein [Fibrobacter sp.]